MTARRWNPVKCPCGHPACSRWGLDTGMFYQGSGFDTGMFYQGSGFDSLEDAQLAAAAPAMYDALREYKRLRDQYRPDPAPHEWTACEERIDAALRAAEGKS